MSWAVLLSCTSPRKLPSVRLVLSFSMLGFSNVFSWHYGRRWVISQLVGNPTAPPSSHRKPDIDFLSVANVLPVVCTVVITYARLKYAALLLCRVDILNICIYFTDREDQSILCTWVTNKNINNHIKKFSSWFSLSSFFHHPSPDALTLYFSVCLTEESLVLGRQRTPRRWSSIWLTWLHLTRLRKTRSVPPLIRTAHLSNLPPITLRHPFNFLPSSLTSFPVVKLYLMQFNCHFIEKKFLHPSLHTRLTTFSFWLWCVSLCVCAFDCVHSSYFVNSINSVF